MSSSFNFEYLHDVHVLHISSLGTAITNDSIIYSLYEHELDSEILTHVSYFLKQMENSMFMEGQLTRTVSVFIQKTNAGFLIVLLSGENLVVSKKILSRKLKVLESSTTKDLIQSFKIIINDLLIYTFLEYLNENLFFPFYFPVIHKELFLQAKELIDQASTHKSSEHELQNKLEHILREVLKGEEPLMVRLTFIYNIFLLSMEKQNENLASLLLDIMDKFLETKQRITSRSLLYFLSFYLNRTFKHEHESSYYEDLVVNNAITPLPLKVITLRMSAQYLLMQLNLLQSQEILNQLLKLFIQKNISMPTEQSFSFFLLGKINSLLKKFSDAFQFFNLALDLLFLIPKEERLKIQGIYLQEFDKNIIESLDGLFFLLNKNYFLETESYFMDLLLILFNYGLLPSLTKNPLIHVKLHLFLQALFLKKGEVKEEQRTLIDLENYVSLFLEILSASPHDEDEQWLHARSKLFQLIQDKYGLRVDMLFIFYNDGRMIYSFVSEGYSLAQSQDELFGGIISAINSVVEELTGEEGIKEIILGSRSLLVSKTQNFMLVIFTTNTRERIEPFTHGLLNILKTYDPVLSNWYGDNKSIIPLIRDVKNYLKDELQS